VAAVTTENTSAATAATQRKGEKLGKAGTPYPPVLGRPRGRTRQWALAALLGATLVAGCGPEAPPIGTEGHVAGFFGGVAGDEPNAVLIARQALSAGGTAADAATAYAFTLAVTMPSRASLGGGGVCVVHRPKPFATEMLDFMPRAPAASAAAGAAQVAVPGTVRGLFALQARYGRLRWETLVFPAERLARFGGTVSRAFAADLASAEGGPALPAPFLDKSGKTLAEGAALNQFDLAATLGRIRTEGPGAIYSGQGAHQYVAGVQPIGGTMTVEDLRDYKPAWQPTIDLASGSHTAHFAGAPATGGRLAAALWAVLGAGGRWADATPAERPHLLAEAMARIEAAGPPILDAKGRIPSDWADRVMAGYDSARHHNPPGRPAQAPVDQGRSTGFVAMDRDGGAVACALTAGKLFGTRHLVAGTGIVAASVPGPGAALALAPVVIDNANSKETFAAMAAAGDPAAPAALAGVMLRAIEDKTQLHGAIAAQRLDAVPGLDAVLVENADDAIVRGLAARGHRVGRVRALARVNAMYCGDGIVRDPESCALATDPRGHGLAPGAEPDR
jgi:gamma-glutamyltranspeptidase / glutathione hydrolase